MTLSSTSPSSLLPSVNETFCATIEDNVTRAINSLYDRHLMMSRSTSSSTTVNVEVARVINDIGVPIVAIFGLLGNALNLAVLTRKRLQRTMADRLERSAHASLVALAVSDVLVCLSYAAASILQRYKAPAYGRQQSLVPLYLDVYREPVLNVFLLSSTWLTVVMAIERYVAVCRPLHARSFISLTGTRVAIATVFVASLAVNGPRFWHYTVVAMPCSGMVEKHLRVAADACAAVSTPPCSYYVKQTGLLYLNYPQFTFAYGIIYFIFDIVLPLPALTFCNVCLALALRRSRQLQLQQSLHLHGGDMTTARKSARSSARNDPSGCNATAGVKSSHDRLTRTLIGLIIMLIFLVGPSEILDFFRPYVLTGGGSPEARQHRYRVYHTATAVTNFMLLVNFAVNFVLYCVVNANFRRTFWDMVSCRCLRRRLDDSGTTVRGRGVGANGRCVGSTTLLAERRGARQRTETYEMIESGRSRNDVSGTNSVIVV